MRPKRGAGSSPCVDGLDVQERRRASAGVDLSSVIDLRQRSSMSALMDSRPVVFSGPSTAEAMQRQGLVQAFRQTAAADWFRSSSSCWSDFVVLRTVVGALETLPPHRLLTLGQVTHHVLALVPSDTVAPGRGGGRPSARPPGAPCRHLLTRSPWETSRPRSTKQERGQHLLVLGVRLDKAQELCPPSS